jgi:tRNA A-37 threonylcarbamoyl transferase component Bud32
MVADPLIGTILRGHRIKERLPASGIVYVAEHEGSGLLRVLKMPDPAAYAVEELVVRFRRETQLLAKLKDVEAVPDFVDAGELDDGRLFPLMGHIDGVTLERALKIQMFPPKRVARIVVQIAGAIAEFHARGIVHRDLAARNIILCDGDVVRIVDFGDAHAERSSLTRPNDWDKIGSAESPQAKAGKSPEPSDDVYAVGLRLREMIGERAPRRLRAILRGCLATEPKERYTAIELRDALDEYPRGTRGALPAALAAAALAVIGIVGWWSAKSIIVAELLPPRQPVGREELVPLPIEVVSQHFPARPAAREVGIRPRIAERHGQESVAPPATLAPASEEPKTIGVDPRYEFGAPVPYGKYHTINRMKR